MRDTQLETKADKSSNTDQYYQQIIEYYSSSGMDYEPWSRNFNMHFGYYRFGLNPFKREQMLDEMTRQVGLQLSLREDKENSLIDLGCGVGASARYLTSQIKRLTVLGVTIVPWQIDQAKLLSQDYQYKEKVRYQLGDYRELDISSNTFDGAYAMESACYDFGKDKRRFLEEAFRVLKPGAKFCVVDGFTKKGKQSRLFNFLYRKVCQGWVLEDFAGINDFEQAMREVGFTDIYIKDISWRVSLSASFVPWVSVKYFFKTILFGKGNKRVQLGHFIAPMYGLLMGLHRRQYGYYIISARKPAL